MTCAVLTAVNPVSALKQDKAMHSYCTFSKSLIA